MTLEQFITKTEETRGKFKKDFSTEFETIFTKGSPLMRHETCERKHIGVAKLVEIADNLTMDEQEEFCQWLNVAKRTAAEVKTKYLSY